MLQYLKFLWLSSNQHGVHSPYVYQYLTKGLYQTKRKYANVKPKTDRLVVATTAYFNFKNIYCENDILKNTLKEHFPDIRFEPLNGFYDLIILDQLAPNNFEKSLHNDSLVITRGYKASYANSFKLVMNFYHCEVLSNRKEQKKQIFYLRY